MEQYAGQMPAALYVRVSSDRQLLGILSCSTVSDALQAYGPRVPQFSVAIASQPWGRLREGTRRQARRRGRGWEARANRDATRNYRRSAVQRPVDILAGEGLRVGGDEEHGTVVLIPLTLGGRLVTPSPLLGRNFRSSILECFQGSAFVVLPRLSSVAGRSQQHSRRGGG